MKLFITKVNGNMLQIVCENWDEAKEKFKNSFGNDVIIELISTHVLPS
jgi:hypothetical protein